MENSELNNIQHLKSFRDNKLQDILNHLKDCKRLRELACDEDGWLGGCAACPMNPAKDYSHKCAEFDRALDNEISLLEKYFDDMLRIED